MSNINTTGNITLCLNSSNGNIVLLNSGITVPLNNPTTHVVDFRINKHELRREISVTEFAHEARITRQAVVKMISSGRLKAQRVGEQYIIDSEELVRYLGVK